MTSPAAGPRTLVSFLLLAVVVVMVPLSVLGGWLHATVSDTDAYVEESTALLQDDAVRENVSRVLSQRVVDAVSGGQATSALDGLLAHAPASVRDQASAAGAGAQQQLRQLVASVALQTMDTPAFAAAWAGSNRAVHEQLVSELSSDAPLTASSPPIALDLDRATSVLRRELAAQGFPGAAALPDINGRYPLMSAEKLEPARKAYGVLDTWAPRAPWIALAALALGLAVANRRLVALSWTALASGVALVACLPLISLTTSLLVDAVAGGSLGDLVGSMADVVTGQLAPSLWLYGLGLLGLGAVARVGAVVAARAAR